MFKNRSNESHTHTNWVEILFKVMRNEAEKGKFLEIITGAGCLQCFVEEENASINTDFYVTYSMYQNDSSQ